MSHARTALTWIAAATIAVAGLTACGSDDSGDTTPTTPSTSPAVPDRPTTPTSDRPTTPTTDGGGSAQAGAPSFTSFEVSSPVQCQDGNATAQMSFETMNVVQIEIKIGDGSYESTAGYGPNESDVVASIPCSGAGESSIQLRG
jgi:hypothetical protein